MNSVDTIAVTVDANQIIVNGKRTVVFLKMEITKTHLIRKINDDAILDLAITGIFKTDCGDCIVFKPPKPIIFAGLPSMQDPIIAIVIKNQQTISLYSEKSHVCCNSLPATAFDCFMLGLTTAKEVFDARLARQAENEHWDSWLGRKQYTV